MDDTANSRASDAGATRKRRSSILKTHRPPRAPFSELEFNVTTPTDTAKSRRVSFSRRTGVAEFVTNEATTTWKNFYEEQNRTLESSGNESEMNPPRPSVGQLGKRIFDQQFQEVDAIDLLTNFEERQSNIESSFNNENLANQFAALENDTDSKPIAPQHKFELSSVTDNQSKMFGNDLTESRLGEITDDIDLVFLKAQKFGCDTEDIVNDLENIENNLQRVTGNVVGPSAFVNRRDMSEYIEIDLNTTQIQHNSESDMSITETVKDPKVNVLQLMQQMPSSSSSSKDSFSSKGSNDWVANKENIAVIDKENIAINPYAAPKISDNFAINEEPDKVLVFDGKRLTIQTSSTDTLHHRPVATSQRKTIVLNTEDDLPNFVENPKLSNLHFNVEKSPSDEVETSMTVYDTGDISMTQCVPLNIVDKRKSTHDCVDISLTQAVPCYTAFCNAEEKHEDIDDRPDFVENEASSSEINFPENKVINSEMFKSFDVYEEIRDARDDTGNISMTRPIPSNIIERRKSSKTCEDVSFTQAVPGNLVLVNKNKTTDKVDISLSQPREIQREKRRTIVFEDDTADISMTQAVPTNIVEKININNEQKSTHLSCEDTDMIALDKESNKSMVLTSLQPRATQSDVSLVEKAFDKSGVALHKSLDKSSFNQLFDFGEETLKFFDLQPKTDNNALKKPTTSDENSKLVNDDFQQAKTEQFPDKYVSEFTLNNKDVDVVPKAEIISSKPKKSENILERSKLSTQVSDSPVLEQEQSFSSKSTNDRVANKENIAINPDAGSDISDNFAINEEPNKVLLFDGKQMSTDTLHHRPVKTLQRKTIVLNTEDDLPNFVENPKLSHLHFNMEKSPSDEVETSMTVYDTGDISMTQCVPLNIVDKRKSTRDCVDISLTQAVPCYTVFCNAEEKHADIDDRPDFVETKASSSEVNCPENKAIDSEMFKSFDVYEEIRGARNDTGNISMTRPIPSNIIERRKSSKTCEDVSFTQAVPGNLVLVNKNKTTDKVDMSISQPREIHGKKRRTIVFDDDTADISMTQAVPTNIFEKIELNNHLRCDDTDMIVLEKETKKSIVLNCLQPRATQSNLSLVEKTFVHETSTVTLQKILDKSNLNQLFNFAEETREFLVLQAKTDNNPIKKPTTADDDIKSISKDLSQTDFQQAQTELFRGEDVSEFAMNKKDADMHPKAEIISSKPSKSENMSEKSKSSTQVCDNPVSEDLNSVKTKSPYESRGSCDEINILRNLLDMSQASLASGLEDKSAMAKIESENQVQKSDESLFYITRESEDERSVEDGNVHPVGQKAGKTKRCSPILKTPSSPTKKITTPTKPATNSPKLVTSPSKTSPSKQKQTELVKSPSKTTPNKQKQTEPRDSRKQRSSKSESNKSSIYTSPDSTQSVISPSKKSPEKSSPDPERTKNSMMQYLQQKLAQIKALPIRTPKEKVVTPEKQSINGGDLNSSGTLLDFLASYTNKEEQSNLMDEGDIERNVVVEDTDTRTLHKDIQVALGQESKDIKTRATSTDPNFDFEPDLQTTNKSKLKDHSILPQSRSSPTQVVRSPSSPPGSHMLLPHPPMHQVISVTHSKEDLVAKRLSFASRRQSIVLSTEELKNNMSMAQAALKSTMEDSPMRDENSKEEKVDFEEASYASSPWDLHDSGCEERPKYIRGNNDVVKSLRFEDDDDSMSSEYNNHSALRKSNFGEFTLNHDQKRSDVIPSYLKDVSDGVKQLMCDLVKPNADILPFETAQIDRELRKRPSTCSLQIQANIQESSQVDLQSVNSKRGILRSGPSSPSGSFVDHHSHCTHAPTITPDDHVIIFDHNNPLNNILLPRSFDDVHSYREPTSSEDIEELGSRKSQVCFKDTNEFKSTQFAVHTVERLESEMLNDILEVDSGESWSRSQSSSDKAVDPLVVNVKNEEVNTVIAMRDNAQLLGIESSLTFADEPVDNDMKSEFSASSVKSDKKPTSHFEIIYETQNERFDAMQMESIEEMQPVRATGNSKRRYSPQSKHKHCTLSSLELTPKPPNKVPKQSYSPAFLPDLDYDFAPKHSSKNVEFDNHPPDSPPTKISPKKGTGSRGSVMKNQTSPKKGTKKSPSKNTTKFPTAMVTVQQCYVERSIVYIDDKELNKQIISSNVTISDGHAQKLNEFNQEIYVNNFKETDSRIFASEAFSQDNLTSKTGESSIMLGEKATDSVVTVVRDAGDHKENTNCANKTDATQILEISHKEQVNNHKEIAKRASKIGSRQISGISSEIEGKLLEIRCKKEADSPKEEANCASKIDASQILEISCKKDPYNVKKEADFAKKTDDSKILEISRKNDSDNRKEEANCASKIDKSKISEISCKKDPENFRELGKSGSNTDASQISEASCKNAGNNRDLVNSASMNNASAKTSRKHTEKKESVTAGKSNKNQIISNEKDEDSRKELKSENKFANQIPSCKNEDHQIKLESNNKNKGPILLPCEKDANYQREFESYECNTNGSLLSMRSCEEQTEVMMDWQPELMNELSSKSLITEQEDHVDVLAIIDKLPFMGKSECKWDYSSKEKLSFRLLHEQLNLDIQLGESTTASEGGVRSDTPVAKMTIENLSSGLRKKNPVAYLCVLYAEEAIRYLISRKGYVVRAGDIPALLRRCASVARVALRWGHAMHEAWAHLAFKVSDAGVLTLKVANIPLRSIWEVTMHFELVIEDATEVPWPRASNVKVCPIVSDYTITDKQIESVVGKIQKNWGHIPRTVWKMFRFLKSKTREPEVVFGSSREDIRR